MATYNYTTTGPNASITITTSDTLSNYDFGSGPIRQGYAITGISGTINGNTITGLLSPGATSGNPARPDNNGTGGNTIGNYNNVFWTDATGGNAGYSYFGLDNQGIGFTTNGNDYKFYSLAGSNAFRYSNGGSTAGFASASSDAPCYVTGTLIRTARGDVAIEDLAVGDIAITRDGRRKPIRWIGQRLARCDSHPEPRKVWPVRVKAGTFGEGLPYADLWISPGHALCLDNSLVPVRGLIDGDRITQVEQDAVTYWHVELDGHDVLLANGMPAESYLDTGNRRGFDNADVTSLHFDEDPAPGYDGASDCLPMVESGPRLSAIRARYGLGRAAPAGLPSAAQAAVHLVVDGATIAPLAAGDNELRFVVPAGAGELRLVSPSFQAAGADVRRLGVIVGGLAVSDGAGWREIALDAPGLYAGFHDVERWAGKAWRWTDGEAHLAPSLWAELAGPVLLRITGQFAGFHPVEASEADEARAAA